MATINQLKLSKALKGDGARQTKFDAYILLGDSLENEQNFLALVKTAQFPSISSESIPYKYKGRTFPIRGNAKYSNSWTCELYLQEDHELKLFLEQWMHQGSQSKYYQSEDTNTLKIRESGIYKTIQVIQRTFDDSEKTVVYELKNVVPKTINQINVDYSQVGTVLTMTVEFSFSHYEYTIISAEDSKGFIDSLLDKGRDAINKQKSKIQSQIDQPQAKLASKLTSSKKKSLAKVSGTSSTSKKETSDAATPSAPVGRQNNPTQGTFS